MSDDPHRAVLASAVAAAAQAAVALRERAARLPSLTWEEKAPADFVSEADFWKQMKARRQK